MNLTLLQIFLATIFIIGIGTFVLIGIGVFAGIGLERYKMNTKSNHFPFHLLMGIVAIISLWFGTATAVSISNLMSVQLVIPFFLIPVILGTIITFIPKVRDILQEIPTHWLIYIQAYRMAGGIFLFPYMTNDILTRGFALNAGIGDVLTGILALVTGWVVMKDPKRWSHPVSWLFIFFTLFGIGDLILANISANISGFAVEGIQPNFPITMIPLFYGPGLGVLLHLVTARNFWLRRTS